MPKRAKTVDLTKVSSTCNKISFEINKLDTLHLEIETGEVIKSDTKVELFIMKPDNKLVSETITTISGSTIKVDVKNGALDVAGIAIGRIKLSDSDGIVSTAPFYFTINDSFTNDEAIINSVGVEIFEDLLNRLEILENGGVSQEDINTAVNNYLTEHPVQSGATAAQAAQIQANKTAIQTVNETIGNKNGLPIGDANIIASINRIDNKQFDTVTDEQISTAVNNYLTEHPVAGGATAEQATQIEANRTAIGDSNSGLIKEVNDIKNTELQNLNTAILGINETLGDKTGLPSGDANIIASINRIDSKTSTGGTGLTSEQEAKLNSIDNKVDKIDGKSLSTNDYTNEEKQTVANLKATVGDTSSGLVKDVKDLKENGVSQDNINVAIENYLTEHPVAGGATAEQATQIEANRTAIGDSNSGLIKEVNDIKNTELQNLNSAIQTLETLVGLDETIGDKSGLPSGDANVIASINRIDGKTLSESNILISPDNSKFKLKVDNSGKLSTEKINEYGQIILSTEALTINEGGNGTFTISIDNPPYSSQTVNISCDDPYITISPKNIVFDSTNYSDPQTITIKSNNDNNTVNDTVNIDITSDNVTSKQITLTIIDRGEVSPNTIFDMSDFTIDERSDVMTLSEDGYYVITNNGIASVLPTLKMTNDSKFNILQPNTNYKVKIEVSENTFTSKCGIFNASHVSCLVPDGLRTNLVTGECIFKSNSDATENQNRLTNNYIFRFQVPAETGTIKFKIKVLENTI